jgi:hypothetical protein
MTIRVTVQNAANHGLNRAEVEVMLTHVPSSWGRHVKSVVLYEHQQPAFRCTYYEKEKILGLFWPSKNQIEQPAKADAVEEMLLSLSVIAERGSLPERLSSSLRNEHLSAIGAIRKRCLEAIGENAT